MKLNTLFFLLIFSVAKVFAQTPNWSPYATMTYKYTEADGKVKLQLIVKKDSVLYQSFEPGKEMKKSLFLTKEKQDQLAKLLEDHKFFKMGKKSDIKDHGNASYTYVKDKFMKVVYEPNNSKRQKTFEAFSKEFLGALLPLVFKEELKGSWH